MNERGARIAAVAAAVAAVAAVLTLLVTTYGRDDATTSTARSTTPPVGQRPAPAGPPAPTRHPSTGPTKAYAGDDADPDGAHDPVLDGPARRDVRRATARFLAAWLTPGTPAQRTDNIGPYATTELTRLLAMTARANVPDADVRGKPDIVDASAYTATTVARLTDGERLRCNLILDTSGWRVSEILPEGGPARTPTKRPGAR